MSTQTEPQITEIPEVRSQNGTPTWEIARLFPNQGHWTEGEYLSLDTNRLIEFCDGRLEFLPMPGFLNQRLVVYILNLLQNYIVASKLDGEVLPAPLWVRTLPDAIREPDVVYVKPERIVGLHEPSNAADLVVEVVSPGKEARKRDLEEKRNEYAQAGISEYWIVDPETETVTVLALEGASYREHGKFTKRQSATSVLLPEFALDVKALFAAGQAKETEKKENKS